MTTGAYSLIDIPVPKQTLIHIHPGAEELGRVYHATLPVNASIDGFLSQLRNLKPQTPVSWAEMYGTIRMHQERNCPGRVEGTKLTNPDFAAYARAFGLHGETVEETAEFAAAFKRCEASGKPALIEILIDPEALTPRCRSAKSAPRRLDKASRRYQSLARSLAGSSSIAR